MRTRSSTARSTQFARVCRARWREAERNCSPRCELRDEIGQLSYKVWYFASLWYDQDQRDNEINARRQQVQILFAKAAQASAWFDPELLAHPARHGSAVARRQRGVERLPLRSGRPLPPAGTRAGRQGRAPALPVEPIRVRAVRCICVAVHCRPEVADHHAAERCIHDAHLRPVPRAACDQPTTRPIVRRRSGPFTKPTWRTRTPTRRSTTASSSATGSTRRRAATRRCSRRRCTATTFRRRSSRTSSRRRRQARSRSSAITSLRRRVLGLATYHTYDSAIPLVEIEEKYPTTMCSTGCRARWRRSATDYQRRMKDILAGQCIDVYENTGKRSGAYSAPVYGCPPFMLLNYNDTLDAVFTLAHEIGHSMHTVLAHEHQPFVYASYTIFVAEVPSTLSEALFLRFMLERTTDPKQRIVLLQHAIDGIVGTFYTQVMFADFELQAHRLVEEGKPITAEVLSEIYFGLLKAYNGDAYRLRRAVAHHVGAHPALLRHALLRLPVRDLLRVERADPEADPQRARGGAACRGRALPVTPQGGRQRPSDGAAAAAGVDLGRPESGPGGGPAARRVWSRSSKTPSRNSEGRAGYRDVGRVATEEAVPRGSGATEPLHASEPARRRAEAVADGATTIAMVGASSDPEKTSHGIMRSCSTSATA